MLTGQWKELGQNKAMVRYCVLCGVIFALLFTAWLLLWRLEFVQRALAEMKQMDDAMQRRVEFDWLGTLLYFAALTLSGIFGFAFVVLDTRMLGPRPYLERKRRRRSGVEIVLSALLSFFFVGKLNSLEAAMYFLPVVSFLFALLLFYLRLRERLVAARTGAGDAPVAAGEDDQAGGPG